MLSSGWGGGRLDASRRRFERDLSTLTEEDEVGVSNGGEKNRRDQGKKSIMEIITHSDHRRIGKDR